MKFSHIILASQSPQRSALLRQIACSFSVDPVPVEETVQPGLAPAEVVTDIARQKAAAFFSARAGLRCNTSTAVLTADTIVAHDGCIMGKPTSPEQAREYLSRIAGRRHTVYTGVHIADVSSTWSTTFMDSAEVYIRSLTEQQIDAYILSDEWRGAAGGYRIQGAGGALVERIDGAYPTVVGLPIHRIYGIVVGIEHLHA